jgi:hypothetical protein
MQKQHQMWPAPLACMSFTKSEGSVQEHALPTTWYCRSFSHCWVFQQEPPQFSVSHLDTKGKAACRRCCYQSNAGRWTSDGFNIFHAPFETVFVCFYLDSLFCRRGPWRPLRPTRERASPSKRKLYRHITHATPSCRRPRRPGPRAGAARPARSQRPPCPPRRTAR